VEKGRAGFPVSPNPNTWSYRGLRGVVDGKQDVGGGKVDPKPNPDHQKPTSVKLAPSAREASAQRPKA